MSVESLSESIPDFAKDLRLNLSSLLRQTELSEEETWGTVAACALAVKSERVAAELLPDAEAKLSPEAFAAAKMSASIMGMNNIYYRFLHLVSDSSYKDIPARLRMNGLRSHGVSQSLVELWCLAVSAINGCGACVDSHERTLREQGVEKEKIAAAVRIAAAIHGIATVLR